MLEYFIAVVVGFGIGWWVREQIMLMNLIRNADDVIKNLQKVQKIMAEDNNEDPDAPDDAIEVQTEQVNDLVYAYNKVTGEFLAQAQSLHQVMVLAAKRYPGKKFWHPELTKDSQTA